MANNKLWFLVKNEWAENDMLSDEQFGMLIRALYSSSMPKDDLAKGMYIASMQEYARVNKFKDERAQARSEKAKNAAKSRWSSNKSMLEHASIDIDINKDIDIERDIVKEFNKVFE